MSSPRLPRLDAIWYQAAVIGSSNSVISITAHARSGALEQAWVMFRAAGLESVKDDPAVLSVQGRLLKDSALAAKGGERRALYLKSAAAYAKAAKIGGALYPLINAATLSLLGGRADKARALARQVIERGRRGEDEPETPYWRAATQAEATLLLGETEKAKAQFAAAIALAPLAYEDHASTLRQFGLILDALHEDKTWLDAHRPPKSAHFAGHMALASRGGKVEREIRDIIRAERIGFGYGALAAGADIVIAEALLEAGAELHLILPAPVAQFRKASVARFGASWARRFDAILEDTDKVGVRALAGSGDPLSALAIRLATEIAMGSAVMHAATLMSEAVQLLILESARASSVSAAAGAVWRGDGRRQHVILAARAHSMAAAKRERTPRTYLAALVRIDPGSAAAKSATAILPRLARALAALPETLVAPRWTGEEILLAYDTVSKAANAALAAAAILKTLPGARIAGHYALVESIDDPFGGAPVLGGGEAAVLKEILQSTPPLAAYVSEDFAAALHAGPAKGRPRVEFVGELPPSVGGAHPMKLYSLGR
jgi:MAP3K TRAFs-binding domain